MRTPKEIKEAIEDLEKAGKWASDHCEMIKLEIMCNIAITLGKIAKQGEPEIRIKEIKNE